MYREISHVVHCDYPRRVVESLTTAIAVLDARLRVVYMNPAAEMLFALSFRQSLGLSFGALAIGADALMPSMSRCLESTSPYIERELPLVLPGQHTITVDCTVTPLVEEDAAVELLVELRQVDRQLRMSREENLLAQLNTIRALVRNLAHEIKNPLGGLRGAAQLLERELPDESLGEYTQIIIHEADRLRALVDRMLGPTVPPAYAPVNIHEILERVRNLVAVEAGPGILIERDYDPSIPPVPADADRLIQALLNVARNAVQAVGSSGHITLRSRIQRQCTIGHVRHKLVARLEIEDDGPGIPEEIRERIFYPMISGRPDGTGLGLSIAQSVASQHGGLVECSSSPGETIFTLLLPLERANG